ncbi:MAG: tRNA (adenosine(37)-N6)-threonylcarbamoyltransferase complex dimerization subunit type 1 TsaB, partial [Muribaculaceae bacterium]|nr:tRNA (adenosine(37)-N6)-threonylcarbamoyltransferase complex dimerization subunit type 1 TsaB [Muribaculaceae bacterium]
ILKERKVIFMGNGSEKAKSVITSSNAEWAGAYEPVARDMLALSEKHYREGRFIDRAYSVPEYLKEYQTTTPKNKLQA